MGWLEKGFTLKMCTHLVLSDQNSEFTKKQQQTKKTCAHFCLIKIQSSFQSFVCFSLVSEHQQSTLFQIEFKKKKFFYFI